MKSKLYIGCHTEERNEYGFPKFKSEVVLDVEDFGQATQVLRGLKHLANRLLNKDSELIKQLYGEGKIKI